MYLVTGAHAYTARDCVDALGISPFGEVMTYEALDLNAPPPEFCIFSDLERLSPELTAKAEKWWGKVEAAGGRTMNYPSTSLRRYELLCKLHQLGKNSFKAYRGLTDEMAFPVFLRSEREHTGALSPLIKDRNALMAALMQTALSPQGRGQALIAVEYIDVSVGGIFHKYSAFRVGDTIIPRHLFFGKKWCLKKPELQERDMLDRELVYLAENPHESRLRAVFDIARIEYGRIDYSMVGERMEVWEINTNPVSIRQDQLDDPIRGASHREFAERFAVALEAL
jgi:hypothetical protein